MLSLTMTDISLLRMILVNSSIQIILEIYKRQSQQFIQKSGGVFPERALDRLVMVPIH